MPNYHPVLHPLESDLEIDPDPFVIALGIFQIIAAGAAFLKTRRRNDFIEMTRRQGYRAAWFQARRSLIYFNQTLSEFETYMLEEGFSGRPF